jgi:putative MATE family efflux protein
MSKLVRYSAIWRVSYPIILGGIAQNIVNVTDTAFLGRLSMVALGAAGNAGIFYFVLMVVGLGFGVGSQIVIGRRNGEGNYHQIGSILNHGIAFLIPLALILFLFIQFISPLILAQLTSSPNILDASTAYLEVRSYGIGFAFLNYAFIALFTGITKTKVLTYATFLQAGINVFLDYGLIFGNFGLPEWGVKGAALASVISEFAALLFFVTYSKFFLDYKKYHLYERFRFEWSKLNKLVSLSSPIMLQNFLALASWLSFFMIIEQMGEQELAASHIVRSIYMVLMIPLFGFSSATSSLVSNLIGSGSVIYVGTLVKRIVLLSIGCTLLLLPLILLFPETICGFYTKDPALIEACQPILLVVSVAMFLFSVAYIVFSAVTGTGKTKVSLLIEVFSILVYLIVAYYISISKEDALTETWMSEFIYFGIMGSLASLYLKFGNWRNTKV